MIELREGSRYKFWRAWPLGVQLTAIVAVLVLGLLAALGLLLDLWLGNYVTSSSASQLHALADPIVAREMRPAPSKPGPQPSQKDTVVRDADLTRLARALSDQVDGPETFALVVTPARQSLPVRDLRPSRDQHPGGQPPGTRHRPRSPHLSRSEPAGECAGAGVPVHRYSNHAAID